MGDMIINILTDADARSENSVEQALMSKAEAAAAWAAASQL